MSIFYGRTWIWWIVVGIIVIYVLNNPAAAAGSIRGWFEAAGTFASTLIG